MPVIGLAIHSFIGVICETKKIKAPLFSSDNAFQTDKYFLPVTCTALSVGMLCKFVKICLDYKHNSQKVFPVIFVVKYVRKLLTSFKTLILLRFSKFDKPSSE